MPAPRTVLSVLAGIRAVLEIIAIPLAPFLYREHAAVLVLLRPTKEVLLFGGYVVAKGDVALPVVVAAALPLLLGGVWLFFALGRELGPELAKKELPGVLGRLLPAKRIKRLQAALEAQGDKVIFLGRVAAMPSSLIAASAGASKMDVRRFVLVDALGALASLVVLIGLGWLLEDAYEQTGPWLTAVGVLALAGVAFVIGRALTGSGSEAS